MTEKEIKYYDELWKDYEDSIKAGVIYTEVNIPKDYKYPKEMENNSEDILEYAEGGLIGFKSKSTLKDRSFEVDSFETTPPDKDSEVSVFVNVKYQYGKEKNYNQGWHKLEFFSDGKEAILKSVTIGKVKNGGGNSFPDSSESASESIHSLDYNYDYPSVFSKKLIELVDEEAKNKLESNSSIEEEELAGGIADGMSLEDIANMHGVSYPSLKRQYDIGVKIESEHTNDKNKIEEITKDHLFENPYYYTMLTEMEGKYEKIKEGTNEPFKIAEYSKGEAVKMFDGEPELIVVEVNEWADKAPTYDLKSTDGSIIRNNIPEDKIYKMGQEENVKQVPEVVEPAAVSEEDTLSIALQDVIENHPTRKYGNLDLGEAKVLYSLDENELNADDSWQFGEPNTLKESVYQSLYEHGYIELSDEEVGSSLAYVISNEGNEFISAVNARMETLKSVNTGLDLFPAEAAITEHAPEKNYTDIKSCLISEGDNEGAYIFEGKEIINVDTVSGASEKWKIVSFFKYGVNLEHLPKNNFHDKKESKRLTFGDIASMYEVGDITIEGIDSSKALNHCLKLLSKCLDLIDSKESTETEKSLHESTKVGSVALAAEQEAKHDATKVVLKKTKEKLKKHQSGNISSDKAKEKQEKIAEELIQIDAVVRNNLGIENSNELYANKKLQKKYKESLDELIGASGILTPLSQDVYFILLNSGDSCLMQHLNLSGHFGVKDQTNWLKLLSELSPNVKNNYLAEEVYFPIPETGTLEQIEWRREEERLEDLIAAGGTADEVESLQEAIDTIRMLIRESDVGNYIAVGETQDGYWIILSKPSTKEIAEQLSFTALEGETPKVVTVDEAKSHKKTVGAEYLFAEGGEVGGRGWGKFEKGKRIDYINDFKVGKLYLEQNNQFNSKNIVLITRRDSTPLDRDIIYGSFVRPNNLKDKEEEFAIWGWQLKQDEFYEIADKEYKNGGMVVGYDLKPHALHKGYFEAEGVYGIAPEVTLINKTEHTFSHGRETWYGISVNGAEWFGSKVEHSHRNGYYNVTLYEYSDSIHSKMPKHLFTSLPELKKVVSEALVGESYSVFGAKSRLSVRIPSSKMADGGKLPESGTPDWHQLQIAKKTIKMNPAMIGVMGGMSLEEAKIILNKHGIKYKEGGAVGGENKLKTEVYGKYINNNADNPYSFSSLNKGLDYMTNYKNIEVLSVGVGRYDLFYAWDNDKEKQELGQLFYGKWNNGNFGYNYYGKIKYVDGGTIEIEEPITIDTATEIAVFAFNNDIEATGLSLEEFREKVFELNHIPYDQADLELAYAAMRSTGYGDGGEIVEPSAKRQRNFWLEGKEQEAWELFKKGDNPFNYTFENYKRRMDIILNIPKLKEVKDGGAIEDKDIIENQFGKTE